jgi:predicted nucleic acid-binding protein
LQRQRRLGIDSCIFIYELEENARYARATGRVFDWLERPGALAFTSTMTMVDLLVQPYREGDRSRADACFGLLTRFPHLEWVSVDLEIADMAARIRSQYKLKTPAALQAATVRSRSLTGFLTNDPSLQRLPEIDVLLLDDVL